MVSTFSYNQAYDIAKIRRWRMIRGKLYEPILGNQRKFTTKTALIIIPHIAWILSDGRVGTAKV